MTHETPDAASWFGYVPRECGEHRAAGPRAWCYDDHEWCYESLPCRGCEIGPLRDTAKVTTRLAANLRAHLLEDAADVGRISLLQVAFDLNELIATLETLRGTL
jgi:hypothetical protein